ncbi:MAG: protein kinase [Kiritimatiellae bacterium]|nr:protein kinase [Kiritimatiellia bacterium]
MKFFLSEATTRTVRGDGLEKMVGRIDQYDLLEELGTGGFGSVFLARDTVAGIDVAVKGLPPEVQGNPEELENVRANFALVSRLHHPHIAAALTLHPVRSVWYESEEIRRKLRVSPSELLLVMSYAPGVTLSRWRRQFPDSRVPLEQAVEIARQVADALDYAHGQRIIHRAIKPSNVMVETRSDGGLVARVLDFGLAAEVRSSMGRVSREVRDTSGTRPYMAPEQWQGEKQDAATDQYALAVLVYELLAGKVPFASAFETGDLWVMGNAVNTVAPRIPEDFPRAVRAALARALSKKREDRFPSCVAFAEALAGRGAAPEPKDTAPSRPGFVKWGVLAACLAAAAFGSWRLWHGTTETTRTTGTGGTIATTVTKADVDGIYVAAKEKEAAERAERERQQREAERKAALAKSQPSYSSQLSHQSGAVKTLTLPGGVEMRFRWCPPGTFMMGTPESEYVRCNDETQHRVTLTKGFWMGETEMTQRQWESVMRNNPSYFKGEGRNLPVENVSWSDCQEFIQKVNSALNCGARLQTEAEWEYACRAGTTGTYGGFGKPSFPHFL